MSYVQDNLMPNEKVLYSARIHPAVFLPAGITFIIGAALALLAFLLDTRLNALDPIVGQGLLVLAVLFVGLSVLYAFQALLVRHTTEFAITNRRIIAKTGFINRHTLEMLLQKVESVAVNQDVPGRILNYGSLTVTGTGGTREKFTSIAEPLAVRRQINQILERYAGAFTGPGAAPPAAPATSGPASAIDETDPPAVG
jgi:uncharacterized membrane protein YdbT with pleckstrin-like domain